MHVCALRNQIEGMGTRFEIIPHFLRPSSRARVYSSVFNARRYNSVIGEFDRRLVARGKTFKQAMTACMRELRVLKELLSPGLEKALVSLDERLMGATSNAVERGNRRYRKMQKTVYRVPTQRAIEGRLALDLLRETQAHGRAGTTESLHKARAACSHRPVSLLQCRGCPIFAGPTRERRTNV
jgi:hypothetical protein